MTTKKQGKAKGNGQGTEGSSNPLFQSNAFNVVSFTPAASESTRVIPLKLTSIILDDWADETRAIELMGSDSLSYRLMAEFCGNEQNRKAMIAMLNDRELYHAIRRATFPGSSRFKPGEIFYLMPALTDTVTREVASRAAYAANPLIAAHLYTEILDAQWAPFGARGSNSTPYALLEQVLTSSNGASSTAKRDVLVAEVIKKEVLSALENYTFKLKDVGNQKLSVELYTDTILHNMSQVAAALTRVASSEQAFDDMLTLLRIYLDPSDHEHLDKDYRQFLTEPLMAELAGNATLVDLALQRDSNTIWTPAWYLERAIQNVFTELRGSSRLTMTSLDAWAKRFCKTTIRSVSGDMRGLIISKNVVPQGVSQVTEFIRESDKLDSWSQVGFRSIETRFDEVCRTLSATSGTTQLHALLSSTMAELDGPVTQDLDNLSFNAYKMFCSDADIRLLAMAHCGARLLKTDNDGNTDSACIGFEIDLAGKHYTPSYSNAISSYAVVTNPLEAIMLVEDFEASATVEVKNQVIPANVRSRYLIGNPNRLTTKLDAQLGFSVGEHTVHGSLLQLTGLTGFGRLRATNPYWDCMFYETFFSTCNYVVERASGSSVKESINTIVAVKLHEMLSKVQQHDLVTQMLRSINTRLVAAARIGGVENAGIELATKLRTERYSKVLRMQCALFLMTRLGLINGSESKDDSAGVNITYVQELIDNVRFFERT